MLETPNLRQPQHRKTTRWHLSGDLSRIATPTVDDTIGYLVDFSLEGIKLFALKSMPTFRSSSVLLILQTPLHPPQSFGITLSTVWLDHTNTPGLWVAGYRIDSISIEAVISIQRYLGTELQWNEKLS